LVEISDLPDDLQEAKNQVVETGFTVQKENREQEKLLRERIGLPILFPGDASQMSEFVLTKKSRLEDFKQKLNTNQLYKVLSNTNPCTIQDIFSNNRPKNISMFLFETTLSEEKQTIEPTEKKIRNLEFIFAIEEENRKRKKVNSISL
jgi:hypothetical protein